MLCVPVFVETPLLDNGYMDEAPTGVKSIRPLIRASHGRAVSPESTAQACLAGLRKDQAVIVAPASARLAWRACRFAPGLTDKMVTRTARKVLAELPT